MSYHQIWHGPDNLPGGDLSLALLHRLVPDTEETDLREEHAVDSASVELEEIAAGGSYYEGESDTAARPDRPLENESGGDLNGLQRQSSGQIVDMFKHVLDATLIEERDA